MTPTRRALATLAAGLSLTTAAHAQPGITLFGTMDTGITYVSNQSGHHNVKMDDGVNGPNLWGIKGIEDLGGGTRALVELVNQYQVDNGQLMSGASMFGRTSTVGLANDRFGKLRIGNQYDFMTDALYFAGDDPAELSGHFNAFRAGPFQKLALPGNPTGAFNWDRMAGSTVANSIKYETPVLGGFSAGALYGFGNVAGSVGAGNAVSFALNYAAGSFGANAAYTNVKTYSAGAPQASVRNWGVGAHYRFGAWYANALCTSVRNSANGGAVYQGSVGAQYRWTPALAVGATYMYMKGNAVVDDNHANQASAIVDYSLSKRTDVYVLAVYQRASSGGRAQINGMNSVDGASSGQTQALARIGLHTRF